MRMRRNGSSPSIATQEHPIAPKRQRYISQLSDAEWIREFDDVSHASALFLVALVTQNQRRRLVIEELRQRQAKSKAADVNVKWHPSASESCFPDCSDLLYFGHK